MKKLALALVCLVSVAFFASCDPTTVVENPEPSIAIVADSGYLYDGQVIELGVEYPYGFRAASNAETLKELAKLEVTCTVGDEISILCDTTISGTEFVFNGVIYFEGTEENREIIGTATITATVTDAAGEKKSTSLEVSINEEENLVATDFSWNRHGGQEATGGLEELGLQWTSNAREIYAVIKPLEGATLYDFSAGRDVWNSITTKAEKAALFSEASNPLEQFKEISCTAEDKDYDFVLGTVYEGEYYLIHITHSHVYTFKGTDVTITGQVK